MVAVVRTAEELAPLAGGVLVPTMGALHAGHVSLIERAAQESRRRGTATPVIVSVFVNPRQFDEQDDFERYPRDPERDAAVAREAGATAVFSPPVEVVYPPGDRRPASKPPEVATAPGLEDAWRPGHLAGVQEVVGRLFELTRPAAAVFGEKDWQQLQLVRALAARIDTPIEIIAAPTVREADGLALSSRNQHLDEASRAQAASIHRALRAALDEPTPRRAEAVMGAILAEAGVRTEYAVVRDAETLLEARGWDASSSRPMRSLIAARAGSTRLIDNMEWRSG